MKYTVFKNYGYVTEELFGQYDDLEIAKARAEQEAEVSYMDEIVEVATFSDTGEYITHFKAFGEINGSESDEIVEDEDDWLHDWNNPGSIHHY